MEIKKAIDVLKRHNAWRRGADIPRPEPRDIGEAIDCAIEVMEHPWHRFPKETPPVDKEVVCKMKGVPHTEHFVCKWDGKYWWNWSYFGENEQGWFGLNTEWEIVEWKEI